MRRVLIPNVFSPNHDGVNEFYTIENPPEGSTLEVFNRWGSLVFKQAPYLNNWRATALTAIPWQMVCTLPYLPTQTKPANCNKKYKRCMWLGKSHLKK